MHWGIRTVALEVRDQGLLGQVSPPSSTAATSGIRIFDELLQIHEYERQRLGQELHDSAGQLLVSLQLSLAHLRVTRESSEHESVIDEIGETVRQIDQEIRSLAFLHYPAELGSNGICAAVRTLARGFQSRTGVNTVYECPDDLTAIDPLVAMAILRVIQESLVNIHRHSHASSAIITLSKRNGSVLLTVCDDGVGFITTDLDDKPHGIGLQGMRHRIETLGGTFKIRALHRGTQITATVPVDL